MSNTSSTSVIANIEQENEVLAHRFHMEIFQEGKLALADEILTPDFVLHNPVLPSELTKGPESIKRFASGVVDCLPDRQFIHHEAETVTAFTVAHSLTLAIATFGYAEAPVLPLNAAIALSIFFLGPEIVRSWRGQTSFTIRHPWVVAFLFGLIHGFGFAGALTSAGLPRQDLPLALLGFNVGVEIGQVGFILARARPRARVPDAPDPLAPLGRGAARVRGRHARRVLDDPAHGDPVRLDSMNRARAAGLVLLASLAVPASLSAHPRGGEATGFLRGAFPIRSRVSTTSSR